MEKKSKTFFVISRYDHDLEPILKYAKDYVLYDRSEDKIEGSIPMDNIGSDLYDKFTFIIDNYDNLPPVMCLTKANLFKYITEEEFEKVKNNKKFTPLLTQNHKTYSDQEGVVCFYKDGMYYERNNYFYLREHPTKTVNSFNELKEILGFNGKDYLAFAPGSNYIVTKKDVLKHSKEFYIKLRSYLDWYVYPGEAQMLERGLLYLWQ